MRLRRRPIAGSGTPAGPAERGTSAPSERSTDAAESVPYGVRVAAAWSWRWLLIVAAAGVVIWLVILLRLIVIPILVAVLLAALLVPFMKVMMRARFPKWLAVTVAMLSLLAGIGLLVFLIVTQLRNGLDELVRRTGEAYDQLLGFLAGPPFNLSKDEVEAWVAQLVSGLQDDSSVLWTGAVSVGTWVGHLVTGLLLALFSTLFFLIDGPRIWAWVVRLMPKRARAAVDGAGRAGWVSAGQYVRVQIFVAFIDAVGIGLGAALLGVPLAIPIAILVFLGAFVPFVGAIVTGAFAAFIALVYNGPWIALAMVGVVLLVQQVESHILQPLVMGSAVRVHPLAVVLAVATGSLIGGIPGAVFAVPLVASANSMVKYIAGGAWRSRVPAQLSPKEATGP